MIVSARHLRVRYRNGALGTLDVSLDVGDGQIVALFGPNGAGKTTSVRAITGFLRSEGARVVSGEVELFGRRMTNSEPYRFSRAGVAVVPERRKVFPNLSVGENLAAVGTTLSRRRREEVTERVFDLFPMLVEQRGRPAGRLSGGQRQMLAIARALITDPKLLVIDEMTLGLHHSMHGPLFAAVRSVAAHGTAVLLVDESTGFALKVADHCYLLNGGRNRDEGPPEHFRGNELLAAGYVEA